MRFVERQLDSQRGHRDTMRFLALKTVREIGHADRDVLVGHETFLIDRQHRAD